MTVAELIKPKVKKLPAKELVYLRRKNIANRKRIEAMGGIEAWAKKSVFNQSPAEVVEVILSDL